MSQVTTSENFQQLIETGKVDEYKPPEEEKAESSEVVVKTDAVKTEDDDDKDLPERVRQQIGKKHRAMKEAEEFGRTQYLEKLAAEQRAEKLEKQIAELTEKSRPAIVEASPPMQSDFNTVDEYIEAMVNYKADIVLKKQQENAEKKRSEDNARQIQNEFAKSLEAAQQKYPDFQEVTESADFDVPAHVTQYLLESDSKAELGYKLSLMYRDDRAELNRILNLSPIRAIAELGKLEVAMTKAEPKVIPRVETKEAPLSKAPAPITPINAGNAGIQKDPSQMTFRELREHERAREAARRQRG